MNQGKTSRYFKYAIGEIILVVIGILIALQVSNWNQNRIETKKMHSYFEKLIEELDEESIVNERHLTQNDSLAMMQKRSLEILNGRDKNEVPELIKSLGAVATSWTIRTSIEIYDEFVAQSLLSKIEDENLKGAFRDLEDILKYVETGDYYLDNQYNTLIEPFFAKNINYSNIALPKYKDGLVQGGPETDFESLFNSMELWNVTTLKLETTNSVLKRIKDLQKAINALKYQLTLGLNK